MTDFWDRLGEIAFGVLEKREEELSKGGARVGSGLDDEDGRASSKERGKGAAGIFTDPELELYNKATGGDYVERPTGMNWDVLRRMARTPPIAAVGNVMCDGLAEFCTPQTERSLPGLEVRIRGKERRYSPTRAERAELERVQRFLVHCGHFNDQAELVNRPDLEATVRASFWDSFRFDQHCWQIEPTAAWRAGGTFRPHRFYAWPAHTIRLATPPEDGSRLPDTDLISPRYVQVDKRDSVVATFTAQQMMFGVMHPLTDIENAGYGYSSLEQLIDVLAAWLYGYGYNKAYFKQGANVRGILHFDTEVPKDQQRRFERYFHALISGVGNAHKVPIAWGGKANWIGLGQNNREMEFSQWLDFLNKVLCAICGIDPVEINFTYGNAGQTGSIGGQENAADRIQASRARWLRPRVRSLFKWMNLWVVWPLNPELEVVPTGIDEKSEEVERKRLIDLAEHTHYVDEVRAMMGDGPMPNGEGKVVLNSVWLQMKQAASGPPDGEGGGDDAEGAGDVPPEKADEAAAKLFGKGADEAGKGDEAGDGARGQGEGAGAPQDGAQPPPKGKTTLPVFDSALIKGERASDELARRVTTWSTRFKV